MHACKQYEPTRNSTHRPYRDLQAKLYGQGNLVFISTKFTFSLGWELEEKGENQRKRGHMVAMAIADW